MKNGIMFENGLMQIGFQTVIKDNNIPDIIRISQITCPITQIASKLLRIQTVIKAMCVCRRMLSLFRTLKVQKI